MFFLKLQKNLQVVLKIIPHLLFYEYILRFLSKMIEVSECTNNVHTAPSYTTFTTANLSGLTKENEVFFFFYHTIPNILLGAV